ncbi:DUF624 domain-containing protein [Vagococcus fluvialis]|uniref:DUF624 domain-containing protein n=1 Tax=Vagococcus fluvialis TaxID=2738 RepID=A0A7X6I3I9_9ENTE|nr:DUF624 domain-containing protein [Vagococcus fluvialis]MDR2277340.1 DUF624 domain-containing protein [Vagococcus sp.]MBO0479733.1 DUF624 domain-containing protein [Vagococcus fluvialis]MBO0485303.1 DUF624 domain-containing protein [Vagococcus fluvialis]MDT2746706.1 DUF624 domain-containing protein [Vagococcus fluvialis]NKC68633.1 DUF624 domain-containing protein [Vagococcus fluvialis]
MSQSKVALIVEKIYQLLMINVCFFITTLPLMMAFIMLKPAIFTIPIYFIVGIPLGPSLFSIVYCLNKISTEHEIQVFKAFFSYWKRVFKLSLILTMLLMMVISVGIVDLQFFSTISFLQWLNPVIILLISLSLIIYSNALFLHQKEKSSVRELIKISIYVTFKNSIISFVNGLLLTVLILGMIIKPAFGFLILPSLLIAVLLWNSQKLVEINNK